MATENRPGDGTDPVFPGDGLELARFDQPTGDGTTFVVVSDPHLTATDHGTLKMFHRTKQRFQMAVADAHRLDADAFVVAGDLTKSGAEAEIALAEELLRIAPRPTTVVPGNHDFDSSAGFSTGTGFAEWRGFSEYPHSQTVNSLGIRAIDTTDQSTSAGGRVDPETVQLLRETQCGPQIAVMHHPLAAGPAHFTSADTGIDYRVSNPVTAADALTSSGVELVVTGHLHWPFATEFRGLNVVGAPGCASFPPAYLLIHVGPAGTTVTLVPLAGASGLTEAYEYAIENDRRGPVIREAVESGYFGEFPLIDQQSPGGSAGPQGPPAHHSTLR